MAKIQNVIFSENRQENTMPNGQQNISIVNPDYIFRPASIPGNFSFSINILLSDILADGRTHTFRLEFINPDGKIFNDTGELPIEVPTPNDTRELLPVEAQGAKVGVDFRNALFKKEGKHILNIYWDSELIGSQDLFIYKQEEFDDE